MFDIVGKRRWYFLSSAIIIVLGLISLLAFRLRLGLDFTGGALLELQFEQPVQPAGVREVFVAHGLRDATVQTTVDERAVLIRSKLIDSATEAEIEVELEERLGSMTELRFEPLGPAIGREVTRAASNAVAMAALAILAYIVIAFRKVPNPLRYGVCAIATMVHDALVAAGLFSLFGVAFGWEVDALLLTALLIVIGFSMQGTIVVLDRIRENIPKRRGEPFETIANRSLLEALPHSLVAQLSAIFILIAILLLDGATVKQFIAVLLIGLLSGTYSSMLNTVPLLVVWEKGEIGQLFRRLRKA